jgi:hypothetical protein
MGRGKALIDAIQPHSPIPRGRVRVLDWSLGGALIELKVPLRRGPTWSVESYAGHWLSLTVKLPPRNATVEVHARVSHARPHPEHADVLLVGLTFDAHTLDVGLVSELDAILQARLPQLQPQRQKAQRPDAETLARESERLARSSRRLLTKSHRLAEAAKRHALEGDRRQAKIVACESRQLEERGRELERESRLCAARSQQQADSERIRALASA